MTTTTIQPTAVESCACTIVAAGTPDEARILDLACPVHGTSPDPDDVWKVDVDSDEGPVSYLAEPIDEGCWLEVTPRMYVEFKAHGNAEPIILSSVEALRLARVLEAAATKLERGEGYVR